jgi:ferredoxin
MQKHLKLFRLIVSLFFLVFTVFILLDFRGTFATGFINKITWLQFIPSFLKFTNLLSLAFIGFFVVLLVTAFFGRAYCSTVCPFGILQDVISFLTKGLRRKKRIYRFSKPWTKVRYSIMAVTFGSMAFGSLFLVRLLDPYSNFGRIVSDLFRPLYFLLNNFGASVLHIGPLYTVDLVKPNPGALILPVLFLALIIYMAYGKGRLYCNTICPVGSLLGLVSKVSVFKIKINESSCTKCGKCSMSCKSGCINILESKVDFSRCVGCYNCVKACPENGIGYQLKVKKQAVPVAPENNNRRDFIVKSLVYAAGLTTLSKLASAQASEISRGIEEPGNKGKKSRVTYKKKNPVSPPGSKSLDYFKFNCTGCHLCISSCPTKVLQPSYLEYGALGITLPRMDYKTSFCNYECTICSEVCPSGAILKLNKEEKKTTQIGIVQFVQSNCIVYQKDTSCGACAEHCPTSAVHMVPYQNGLTIPETNKDICIGCGACEYACPATPYKAIYVEGNPKHLLAQKPKTEKQKGGKLEEFPF